MSRTTRRSLTDGTRAEREVARRRGRSVDGAEVIAVLKGNNLTLLNNGDAFYPVMLDAVKVARHSITIEAYI